jgi:hypothetical protein
VVNTPATGGKIVTERSNGIRQDAMDGIAMPLWCP